MKSHFRAPFTAAVGMAFLLPGFQIAPHPAIARQFENVYLQGEAKEVKKRAIVSVINDLNTDQRVHKVCLFLHANGYDVTLVGRRKKDSAPMQERPYRTVRMKLLFEKGAAFYAVFNLRLFALLLFRKHDLLLSNDLDTLLPNYLVSLLRRKKLVYDTHEYFTAVPELMARPRVQRIWESIEKRIFPKLKNVYTVNDSIAAIYREKYHVPVRVVRNVSPRWNPGAVPSKSELGIPEGKKLMIMQGAGLNIDRGVEEAINAMKQMKNTLLLIVGSGDIIPQMQQKVKDENLSDKVLFFGKRPYAELMNFTFHADLGLSFDQPTNPNYLFSLPNKVFDYIHAGTPIACSNVVEVASLVNRTGTGAVIDDFSAENLSAQLSAILENEALLEQWKANCKTAAQQENWENETEVLREIYAHVR